MFARIKAAWHDPVWSKVIAAAILTVAALIWAVRAVIVSGVYGAIDRAKAGLGGGWAWLGASAPVPRWLLALALLCLVLLMRAARRQGKRLGNLEYSYSRHVRGRHVPPLPAPKPEPEPDKIADGFAPTRGERALLESATHRDKVEFKEARRVLERIDPAATHDDTRRALEILKEAGAVKFFTADWDWDPIHAHPTYGYALTRVGEKYIRELKESKRI
jgi:hypothetical protein